MASEVKTNKISPATSTTINVGDSGDTLALATDAVTGFQVGSDAAGDVLYHDGTDYTRLAKPGTPADEVLTFATGASAPTWVASAAGGMILQVLEDNLNTSVTTTSTSYVASGLSITITPASTASRFLLTLSGGIVMTANVASIYVDTTFYVDGSEVSDTGPYAQHKQSDAAAPAARNPSSSSMIHAPATVSATTYAVFFKASANNAYINVSPARVVFTVMELSS